jgi:NADP-dependent aldehyde dehydrogenase
MIGKHYIAGQWSDSGKSFLSAPVRGPAQEFSVGTPDPVEIACSAAEGAFETYARTSADARAEFLAAIADEIEARAEEITETGSRETGLPEARLQGERERTTGQLRLFAEHILKGDYLHRRHDPALPDRQPLPRPDLRMIQRPIGPVAVFGASNFPLAFSVSDVSANGTV